MKNFNKLYESLMTESVFGFFDVIKDTMKAKSWKLTDGKKGLNDVEYTLKDGEKITLVFFKDEGLVGYKLNDVYKNIPKSIKTMKDLKNLYKSVMKDKGKEVKRKDLIRAKNPIKKINQKDLDDQLMKISKEGNLEKVKFLVSQGADVHVNKDTPIQAASTAGHLDVVKYLVSKGADVHSSEDFSLIWASNNGHLDVVKYLVSKGADIHAGNDTSIQWAAGNGHLEVVKYLVSKGADITEDDFSPLEWAKEEGFQDVVDYLESL